MHKINHANIKEWAKNYDGPLFDGILCDPPYELGFMGKSWDSSGIAFDTEMWNDLYKLLKPGAHLLAFSGSRTYHRMAVAIEDAGFEIRDMIEWVYGSGFPKSLNIGLAIDKKNGVIGNRGTAINVSGKGDRKDIKTSVSKANGTLQAGYTDAQNDWNGYGTALKPAHEPCVLARKPIEGNVAQNCLKHGVGGLNIDGTRVGHNEPEKHTIRTAKRTGTSLEMNTGKSDKWVEGTMASADPMGRFPANLIHDGSDEVEAVFPQTGKSPSVRRTNNWYPSGKSNGSKEVKISRDDNGGSASRFFYTAKASKSERNAGLDGFEPTITNDGRKKDIDNAFQRGTTLRSNHHPTVKPLALTKYLATLIKPPTGGRLLVPFSGSGSEMIGALQAGWEYVEGVELTEEYIPIAEARILHWTNKINKKDSQITLI